MRICRKVAAVLALAAAASAALGADSGGYRGPSRSGVYPEKGLLKKWPEGGPRLLWKYEQLGPAWGAPAVYGGTVYVPGGAPGNLYAFTLDGDLKWKTPYGREFQKRFDGTRSTVTVSDGCAYLISGVGVLYCFDAETGQVKWSVDTAERFKNQVPGWGYNITPLVVDDKVILPIRRGTSTTVAVNKKTGETVWTNEASTYAVGDSSPVLIEHGKMRLVYDNLWHAMVGVDPATGKIVWRREGPSGTTLTPVFNEGLLLVDFGGKTTMMKPRADGKGFDDLWTFGRLNVITQAVILDGKVFGLCQLSKEVEEVRERGGKPEKRTVTRKVLSLIALDARTGKLLKDEPVQKEGSMCAADGMVYLLEGGEGAWQQGQPPRTRLSLIQPTKDGFEIVSSFAPLLGTKEAWVNPAIAEGRLFHRHGSLLAVYDLRAKP